MSKGAGEGGVRGSIRTADDMVVFTVSQRAIDDGHIT